MTASTDAPAGGGETVAVPGDIAAALRDYFGAWEEDFEDYADDYMNDEEEAERAVVLQAFQQASAVWADLDIQAVARRAALRSGADLRLHRRLDGRPDGLGQGRHVQRGKERNGNRSPTPYAWPTRNWSVCCPRPSRRSREPRHDAAVPFGTVAAAGRF